MNRAWALPFGLAFVLLATLNSAGYRYAASDQAFYIPALVRHLDPSLFPRDAPLIDSQARLMVIDDAEAAVVRFTGLSIQRLGHHRGARQRPLASGTSLDEDDQPTPHQRDRGEVERDRNGSGGGSVGGGGAACGHAAI